MPFPWAHILLRVNGGFGPVLATPVDRWSVGFRCGVSGGDVPYDAAKLVTLVNSAHAAAEAFHEQAGTGSGTNVSMINVSGARIGTNGKYSPAIQDTVYSTDTGAFGNGTALHPWSTAHVISLRTALPRGRGSNGRCYWPALGMTIDTTTGRATPAAVLTRLTNFQTFLNALNTALNTYSPGTVVQVISSVGSVANKVTAIRADTRMDHQERRENAVPSVYQSLNIT